MSPFEQTSVYGSALLFSWIKRVFGDCLELDPTGLILRADTTNPEINRDHLAEIHELIQPVVFGCAGFAVANDRRAWRFRVSGPAVCPETEFVRGVHNGGFGLDSTPVI
jgi:hypothetical protein